MPQDLYAGRLITIGVNVFDYDEDDIEVRIDQQLGMGDRYAGNEYVTSQRLGQLTLDGNAIKLQAAYPGNYRVILEAIDKDGTTSRVIDVPLKWALGENPFSIRGVAIDTWGPPDWHQLSFVPNLIKIAHEHGANFVELSPYWHVESITGNVIRSCTDLPTAERWCTTPTDKQLRDWIEYAHSFGMGVFLKPHLIGGQFDDSGSRYDFESWQIEPEDPGSWFESYANFILHYAHIASEEGVEIFAVGNELTGTQLMETRWRELISRVRSDYTGKLTYSDVLLWQTWDGQAWFWDALDYIGVPYYFNGSTSNNNPRIEQMVINIRETQSANLATAMSNFSNPVLATELGRPNFDGTNHNPWEWSEVVDNQEIVDFLEASFTTQIELGDRFKGVFYWVLKPRPNVYPVDWDFRDKPSERAIEFWYSN